VGIQMAHASRRGNENSEGLPADRLLTPADIAAITGLSIETLAQWRSQRRGLPYVKIARNCVRYRQSDFDNWIAGRIVRVDVDAP
jgi:predicted DNA-binding transcriptional regulator AlpA